MSEEASTIRTFCNECSKEIVMIKDTYEDRTPPMMLIKTKCCDGLPTNEFPENWASNHLQSTEKSYKDIVNELITEEELQSEEASTKWFTERGAIRRTLEDKRLKFEGYGHITTEIMSRTPTEKEEREFYFEHQLPKGNPNLLPSLPKEYVK